MRRRGLVRPAAVSLCALLAGCAVGPNYHGPPQDDFPATPAKFKNSNGRERFAVARPADKEPRGPWWEVFRDRELNRLEKLALGENQDLRIAAARVLQSRAQAGVAAADFFPNANFDGSAQRNRTTNNGPRQRGEILGGFANMFGGGTLVTTTQPLSTTYNLVRAPVDLNWEIDLFGRVRRNYESARATVQANEADFQNMLLIATANVAADYFMLRALDAQVAVLHRTIDSRRDSLRISEERLNAGLTDELDVSRARSDLANNESNLYSSQRSRGEMENAIATLVGQPASTLHLAFRSSGTDASPPRIPAGLPSAMLQRRPDVAEAERNLAAANAKIGVAVAAFFPQVKLTGAGGFESADLGKVFDWSSTIWQIGPSVTLPIFEGGRNTANLRNARAVYDQNLATYRKQVLTAFQDVENALVDLRTLADQAEALDRGMLAARRSLELSQDKYFKGASNFLDVLDAERTLLSNELTAAQLVGQRFQTTVQLVKALGGDW